MSDVGCRMSDVPLYFLSTTELTINYNSSRVGVACTGFNTGEVTIYFEIARLIAMVGRKESYAHVPLSAFFDYNE